MQMIITLGNKKAYINAKSQWRERRAARAIVTDSEGRIALIHATKPGYYKLPGGGIDDGEEIEVALKRELLEELGINISIDKFLGQTEEFKSIDTLHQVSYCFAATFLEKVAEPDLTDKELAQGMEPYWVNGVDEAIKLISHPYGDFDNTKSFMIERDTAILRIGQPG